MKCRKFQTKNPFKYERDIHTDCQVNEFIAWGTFYCPRYIHLELELMISRSVGEHSQAFTCTIHN